VFVVSVFLAQIAVKIMILLPTLNRQVCKLCEMAKEIFQREENVKPVKTPVIVVGDGAIVCQQDTAHA
jgi:hypothetical protein